VTARLAIVTTHPVQYYAPWFRHLAGTAGLDVRAFYLWDFGVSGRVDPTFGVPITWDVPLLDGYAHEFVPNVSRRPGTGHYRGIDNPDLPARLRAFDPTAVLCIGYNFATFGRLLRSWDRARSPLVLRGDSHRLVPRWGPKAWLKRQLVSAAFRRFAAFLYVGRANRAYYRLHGVTDDRLFFSPHAIDNDRFTAAGESAAREAQAWRTELGIPAGATVVLFAGKFETKKRPLDLLAAYRAARPPGTALLFVGSGPLEAALREAAAGAEDVFFAPFQNQSRMPRTYAAGDVLVLPSFGPGETWGLCVNEAMCLARPAIVSSHVGCGPDLIAPGETGWTFPAGDTAALAACLTAACCDGAALRRAGAAARERVRGYDYAAATNGLTQCLERLTAGRGSPGDRMR
jgi:glycosyltransferase involved in cell wall biosynthesis